MYDDDVIRPFYEHGMARLDGVKLVDMHAHTGQNDPDGFKCSAETLVRELAAVDSTSIVMPMHEPGGYPPHNDRVLAEAEASDGTLIPFCRLDPNREPLVELRRCIDAGARGIKLHPRAEGFDLSHERADDIFAFAHERRLPVVIHAGRGIPTLAHDALAFAGKYPDARVILAHAGITDLSWIWRELPRCPNLFIDLSWWQPLDLLALYALVPPGQLLYASDLPYFTPTLIGSLVTRYGRAVGLSDEQLTGILGRQAQRVLDGDDLLDLGPAPGPEGLAHHLLLDRVGAWLVMAISRMLIGDSGYELLALARLSCDVGDDVGVTGAVCRSIVWLLDRQEAFARENPTSGAPQAAGVRSIMLAACLARTPQVPLPRIPELEPPEELRRRTSLGHRSIDLAALPTTVQVTRDLRRSSAVDHLAIDPSPVHRPRESGVYEVADLLPPEYREAAEEEEKTT